jgi:hypothetical protein
MIRTRMAVLALLCAVPLFASASACGSGTSSAVGDAKIPAGSAAKALDHEECSESGNRVEMLDTNNDGKPDIRRIFNKSTGREMCRIVDLNHDGKPDMYEYYDASSGTVRRREYCYDDTGLVNAIEYYEAGKLVRREYDTTGLHTIDTWDYFDGSAPTDPKTGRPTHPSRRERDVTGDGKVDQWWTWSGDNVTIAVDSNGDGKPDPASTIVLGKDGNPVAPADTDNPAPPPPAASSAAAASSASAPPSPSSASSAASTVPAPSGSAVAATPASAAATPDGGKP